MVETISKFKLDFEFLNEDPNIMAILLFGSKAGSDDTIRSDTDICIVAPKIRDINDRVLLFRKIYMNVDVFGNNYDIWQFEELALYMKMEIIENHEVIYCKDIPELFEYFYHYRKIWKDQKHRQQMSKEELIKLLDI